MSLEAWDKEKQQKIKTAVSIQGTAVLIKTYE
jgi:hypothetical protein